ncbi:MAG: AlwI family type II restriction endonuclease [Bacteroidales bacterium]|nr:AlwI family type II restriction endonuclease [Bacteroidales bacterium]
MARIDSKVIFVTTSPRTPAKMIPEIDLLNQKFAGQEWNNETQVAFMELLKEENFFNGEGVNDPAFSARDRINRAPKALGFIKLTPYISLTSAGEKLISAKRKEEVFLRQLLKFQIPSPYHKPSDSAAAFWVKPYLELFRLIRHFGSLKFDELMMFGLQLVDYREFDTIVQKIEQFRIAKVQNKGSYKVFKGECLKSELMSIYETEINAGNTKTRESRDKSIDKFLKTKASNLHDYTDACIRYLRATGLVNISHIGRSLSIIPEKITEVDFFLNNTDRNPCFVNNETQYIAYLGNPALPILQTDNKDAIIDKLKKEFPAVSFKATMSVDKLKDILDDAITDRKEQTIANKVLELKDYKFYDDVQNTFKQIEDNSLYDPSLMLEWNVWRAMTMLDGGEIKANLKFDDFGNPMSTAQGNMSDIVCDYGDFGLSVEVTIASGQKQYEMEGEPVSRHLAKLKKATGKTTYCLFVAPSINEACVAHFYALHKMNITYYGGKSTIVPLPLNIFKKMLEDSYKATYTPQPNHVKRFFERSNELVETCENEQEWYEQMKQEALNWLSIK